MKVYCRWPCHTSALAELTLLIKTNKKKRCFTLQLSMLIPRPHGVTDKEYPMPHSPHQRNRCLSSLTSEVKGVRGHCVINSSATKAGTRGVRTDTHHIRTQNRTGECVHAHTRAHAYRFSCTRAAPYALQSPYPPITLYPNPLAAAVFQAKPGESPFNEVWR